MSRKIRIGAILSQQFKPLLLEVENESHNHHVPEGSETHFKVTLISGEFIGVPLIKRHRMINDLLKEELSQGLHALSLHLYTPEEWEKRGASVQRSPACRNAPQ